MRPAEEAAVRPLEHWLAFSKEAHVLLLSKFEGYWQAVENTWQSVRVETLDGEGGAELLQALRLLGYRVYRVAPLPERKSRCFPEFLTCVTLIKRVMGLQRWLIQTPRQLEWWAAYHTI